MLVPCWSTLMVHWLESGIVMKSPYVVGERIWKTFNGNVSITALRVSKETKQHKFYKGLIR